MTGEKGVLTEGQLTLMSPAGGRCQGEFWTGTGWSIKACKHLPKSATRAVPRGLQPQRGSFSGVGDPGLEAALGNIRLHDGLLESFSIRNRLTSVWPELIATNSEAASELRGSYLQISSRGQAGCWGVLPCASPQPQLECIPLSVQGSVPFGSTWTMAQFSIWCL